MTLIIFYPVGHGGVAESHVGRIEAFIPFRVAVGEHYVLAFVVNLPDLERRAVCRTADAILGVVILVSVQRVKWIDGTGRGLHARRIAAQNEGRGIHDPGTFDRCKRFSLAKGSVAPVEIIERPLQDQGQLHIARTPIRVRIPNVGEDLLHPTGFARAAVSRIPINRGTGFGIEIIVVVRKHPHAQTNLVKVGIAADGPCPLFGGAQRRQQHSRENRDDGYDDQQLDEREGFTCAGLHDETDAGGAGEVMAKRHVWLDSTAFSLLSRLEPC